MWKCPLPTTFCRQRLLPQVRGDDSENLSLTRKTQADIWLRHHPQDCSDPSHKFLVTSWIGRFGRDRSIPGLGHGLGSELHVMSSFLSLALAHNRILVIRPHTFMRANHSGCSGRFHPREASPHLCCCVALRCPLPFRVCQVQPALLLRCPFLRLLRPARPVPPRVGGRGSAQPGLGSPQLFPPSGGD